MDSLCWVRKHRVQMLRRTDLPSFTIVAGWILGSHLRLVCRFEWLTL